MYGSNEDNAPLDHDQDLRDREQFRIDKSEQLGEIDLVRHMAEYECAEAKARETEEWDDLRFAIINADAEDDERKIKEIHAMVISYAKVVRRAYRNSWGEVDETAEDKPKTRVY